MIETCSGSKTRGPRSILTPAITLALVLGLTARAMSPGFAPDVATSWMIPADGLAVNLYAAEPNVRQSVLVKFDDRGRLWTVQYRHYQTNKRSWRRGGTQPNENGVRMLA